MTGNSAQYIPTNYQQYYAITPAYHNPILFFENSAIVLISYGQLKPLLVFANPYPAMGVYNMNTNTFTWTEYIFQPTSIFYSWLDSYIDYQHQMLYLLALNPDPYIVLLFAIPFSGLPILLNNLQLPSNFLEASLMIPNGGTTYTPLVPTVVYEEQETPFGVFEMIFYNGTFYIVFIDRYSNIDLWVFSLNEITWSSTISSNLQTVGSVTIIFNTSESGAGFSATFNYYMSNGSIYPEILVVIQWIPTDDLLTILSIDPSTLSISTIATIDGDQDFAPNYVTWYFPAYVSGGLIVMSAQVNNGSQTINWYIFVYDRNTGDMALFPPPNNVILALPAEGGYVITLTGSSTNVTITVSQVTSDSAPALTNITFQNNTITGTAMDLVSNIPVSGVVVALFQLEAQGGYNFAGEIVATTTTDSNGNFSFQVSQPGYYAIRAFT